MNEAIGQTTAKTFRKYIPIVTAICCLISLILFTGINLQGNLDTPESYRKWGAPLAPEIFNGAYWGLITSNFVHVEIWHIAFNLYWLWIFGKKVEFETKKPFYVLFILSSALVSSLAQLAFSETTGIGLSGIGYALFGFLFVKSKTADAYKNYLDKRTVGLFLFWLVLCVILSATDIWEVGNAAHIGGMLWGGLLAYTSKYSRVVRWEIGIIYLSVLIILILKGPFSISYLSYRAFGLHKNQQAEAAIEVYKKILKQDPDNEFAKGNLAQLEIYELQKKARELHTKGRYHEARQLYNQILRLDKDNAWVKENLSRLPAE